MENLKRDEATKNQKWNEEAEQAEKSIEKEMDIDPP
jgi:hypothetical protein